MGIDNYIQNSRQTEEIHLAENAGLIDFYHALSLAYDKGNIASAARIEREMISKHPLLGRIIMHFA